MALIECKKCGHKISERARICPKCGMPTKVEPEEEHVQKQDSKNSKEVMFLSAVSCLEDGRIDEARDYISGLIALEPDCERYKELQQKLDEAQQAATLEAEERNAKRRKMVISILASIILIALIGIGVWQYQKSAAEKEQTRWEQIKDSETLTKFENYLRQYPNGRFKSEVQKRMRYVQEEMSLWEKVGSSGNPNELKSFIKKYPKGKYHDMAVTTYDELLWREAKKENDLDAYRHYMKSCPQGKHYQEAKEKADYHEKIQLDEYETDNVYSTIRQFLYAVGRGDEDSMLECLSSELHSFLGKARATKIDAIAYMRKLHANDVYSIDVTMGEYNIQKKLDEQGNSVYTINFTFDQRISREDTSKETFASYKGKAQLNSQNRITSISLTKTSHY